MDELKIFLGYLRVLNKYKFIILILIIASSLVTANKAINSPRVYVANAVVLLPSSGGEGSAISGAAQMLGLQNLAMTSSSEKIIRAIINSRRMAEHIVEKFDIQNRYKTSSREAAIQSAKGMVFVDFTVQGTTLDIIARASDPNLAADVANFCVTELDAINQELRISSQVPMVKMLDPAVPPAMPEPRDLKRKVLISAIFSAIIGIFLAFLFEYLGKFKKMGS